ncbi:MAG: SPW repeat protein [Burkholderiaceae bacterium]|jgi:SPW repeat
MKNFKHWQDPVNAVLGVALVLSPWVLNFSEETFATVNAVAIGLALVATALGAMLAPKAWEEWSEAILGLWMVISPWALAYSHVQAAMYVAVGGGLIVVLLALWTLATDKEFSLPKSMLP